MDESILCGVSASSRDAHVSEVRSPELFARAALYRRARVFAIEFRNKAGADLSRTNRFAFVRVCAISKSFRIHHMHHFQNAPNPFGISLRQQGQMRDFRRGEE